MHQGSADGNLHDSGTAFAYLSLSVLDVGRQVLFWEGKWMSKIPAVLIVILNYGTYDLTINLIKQLHSNLNYQSYDIMVVDNCSPNESSKVVEENSKV